MAVENTKTILVLSSMAFNVETLQPIKPTMMTLLAMGTTIPILKTPECFKLIEGGMRDINFCACSQPPSYDHSSLHCGTSSSIENHIAPPMKPVKMHNASLLLSVCLLPLQYHPQDKTINTLKHLWIHFWISLQATSIEVQRGT